MGCGASNSTEATSKRQPSRRRKSKKSDQHNPFAAFSIEEITEHGEDNVGADFMESFDLAQQGDSWDSFSAKLQAERERISAKVHALPVVTPGSTSDSHGRQEPKRLEKVPEADVLLAFLAGISYKPLPKRTTTRLAKMIGSLHYSQSLSNDEVAVWKQENGQLLIAIRGTMFDSLQDLKTDALLLMGKLRTTDRYERNRDHIKSIQTKFPISRMTGHSLGGALAAWIGEELNIEDVVVFNPAVGFDKISPTAVVYHADGDAASALALTSKATVFTIPASGSVAERHNLRPWFIPNIPEN